MIHDFQSEQEKPAHFNRVLTVRSGLQIIIRALTTISGENCCKCYAGINPSLNFMCAPNKIKFKFDFKKTCAEEECEILFCKFASFNVIALLVLDRP